MASPQAIAAKPQGLPPVRRMNLAKLVKGKQETPLRVLLFGVEGVGKSSWATKAQSPVFLCAESGTDDLDVERLPLPDGQFEWTWADINEAVRALTEDAHNHKTLVIDTIDAIEPLLWSFLCKRDGKDSIESYGYTKGYIAAIDEWRVFLASLERLRRVRGMNVILIGHSYIKPFKNPEGEDYDRYELKLHNKAAGLIKEWVDDVLFAHYETFAVKADESKLTRAKGYSTGARVVETNRTAAWDAKNRHSLPARLALDYDDFIAAVKAHRPVDPKVLLASIAEKLAALDSTEISLKVSIDVNKAAGDSVELAKIDNRLTATLNARKEPNS